MRFAILTAMLIALPTGSVHAQHRELQELANADQAARATSTNDHKDDERRVRVLEILAAGEQLTAVDKTNAALVLQHTGLTICDGELRSISPENYLLAHHLAKSAYRSGYKEAASLVAQTIDRYLVMTEGRQRYGTNRLIDPVSGEEYLPVIDRTVTDQERAEFGVAPLEQLLAKYKERVPKAVE